MGTGKIAAQVAHAAVMAVEKTKERRPEWFDGWFSAGQAKVVVKVQSMDELMEVRKKAESLRLAILNACEGGRTSRLDPFAGSAQTLVQQGIPAVIAMQFEIADDVASTFARAAAPTASMAAIEAATTVHFLEPRIADLRFPKIARAETVLPHDSTTIRVPSGRMRTGCFGGSPVV